MQWSKRTFLSRGMAVAGSAGLMGAALPAMAKPYEMTVYKSESCGCCNGWIEHMRQAGYKVDVVTIEDVTPIKTRHGVPQSLWSCHTAVVNRRVIEGHVPAEAVTAFLKAPGSSRGIAVGGMPLGSPGMEVRGRAPDTYDVMRFGNTPPSRFMRFEGATQVRS